MRARVCVACYRRAGRKWGRRMASSDEEDEANATARPDDGKGKQAKAASVSLFEFGSAKNSAVVDTTLAGYCPVGDNLDGCEWRPLKNNQPSAPQFRIVF